MIRMIRIIWPMLKSVILAVLVMPSAYAQQKGDISGDWILNESFPDERHAHRMTLEVAGNRVTGHSGTSKIEGTIEGSQIKLNWMASGGKSVEATYSGTLDGEKLKGQGEWQSMKLEWSAHRPATASAPRILTFEPKEFHRAFSADIPPVLHIFPGDTVRTRSVDAGGTDENSVRRSMGGNPLTGPFYVEGALPGDTLVVKLNRVRTNRDWAASGQNMVGNALLPGYLMNLNRSKDFSSRWKLDPTRGVAYLEKPTDALKQLTIPLRPMLGCIGVAPAGREVIATRDSGIFGGNMDYNQLREGTTVYLPVFQEGALLFMGDGHAAQGDGELTGDALETSMEFEFSVDVIRDKSIGTPRAENAEYVMAIGIGGSLDQALQRATTEMARWLERDYKLTSTESAMVLGFAVRYDVADLVGTQVSIVAKIPKSTIAQLKAQ